MTEFNTGNIPDAPQSTDLQLMAALAKDLTALDYTVDGVQQLLGAEAYEALDRDQLIPAQLVTDRELAAAGPKPLAAVVRLWLLGGTLDRDQLASAFPAVAPEGLLALGLINNDGGRFRPAVDLRPYAFDETQLWVASDLGAHQAPGVLRHARPEAELVYVGKQGGGPQMPQEEIDRLLVEQVALVDDGGHPRAALLVRPGVGVDDDGAQHRAVGLAHLEDPRLVGVADELGPLVEGDPVESGRRREHAVLQHPLELQVGLELVGVEGGVGVLARGQELPVPRLQARPGLEGMQSRPQRLRLPLDDLDHAGREPGEQVVDRVGRPGAGDLVDVGGVVRVAEQGRPLGAQPRDPHQGLTSVVRSIFGGQAPADRRAVDALAQAPVLQVVQQRLARGVDDRHQPALEPAVLGRLAQPAIELVVRQPGQVGPVVQGRQVVLGFDQT